MTPWRNRDSRQPRERGPERDVPLEASGFGLEDQVRAEIDENRDDYVLINRYLRGVLSAADREDVEERLRIDSRFQTLVDPLIKLWNLSLTGDIAEHDIAAVTWNKFKWWIDDEPGTDVSTAYKASPDRRSIARHPWPDLPLDPEDFVQFLETELGTDSAIALVYHAVTIVEQTGIPDSWIIEVARGRDRGAISTAVAHHLIRVFAESAMMQLANADPVLVELEAQIDRIEREHGFEEDETWPVNEGPAEWRALNDAWAAVEKQVVMGIFLRNGEREVAHAYSSDDERLDDKGRALVFGADIA